MAINREEFARSIQDPDKMLNYIATSLSYIAACKAQISIDLMRKDMGIISEKELQDRIKETLQKVMYETMDIMIYIASEPLKDKFLNLKGGEYSDDSKSLKEFQNLTGSDLRHEFIENKLAELINGIKNIVHYPEYKEMLRFPK